jgi:hypothetical protein
VIEMGVGEAVNKNPIVGVVIAVVILGIAGYIMMSTSGGGGGKQIEQRYFYDLSTGELTAMGNEPAPVTAASGSQAVWAHVFSCGSCEDESQRFVAYLQKLTDEAKAEFAKPLTQQDSDVIMAGGRVALPPKEPGGEIRWVPADGMEGMRIGEAPLSLCPGGTPKLCEP